MKNTLARFLETRKNLYRTLRYPRKPLDEILEFIRFTKVEPYIPKDATLLDIGAGDGNFLRYLDGHLQFAVGIDSHLTQSVDFGRCRLIPGYFPYNFIEDRTFDIITMMAVTEHIPMEAFLDVTTACWKYLNPNGQLIITVQHQRVEGLLDLLKRR